MNTNTQKLRQEMIKVANLVGRSKLSEQLYKDIAEAVELIRLDIVTPVEPVENVNAGTALAIIESIEANNEGE